MTEDNRDDIPDDPHAWDNVDMKRNTAKNTKIGLQSLNKAEQKIKSDNTSDQGRSG